MFRRRVKTHLWNNVVLPDNLVSEATPMVTWSVIVTVSEHRMNDQN